MRYAQRAVLQAAPAHRERMGGKDETQGRIGAKNIAQLSIAGLWSLPTMAVRGPSVVQEVAALKASRRRQSSSDQGSQALQSHGHARIASAMDIVYTCIVSCQALFARDGGIISQMRNWWRYVRS